MMQNGTRQHYRIPAEPARRVAPVLHLAPWATRPAIAPRRRPPWQRAERWLERGCVFVLGVSVGVVVLAAVLS